MAQYLEAPQEVVMMAAEQARQYLMLERVTFALGAERQAQLYGVEVLMV